MNITAKPSSTTINKTGGWRTYRPKTDLDKCIGCGTCAAVCPENAVVMFARGGEANGKQKPSADFNFCKGCGVCAEECPVKAIEMVLETK